MSKKGNAPRSKPSAQAVARAQQRHRRDKWLMPAIIGGLVVAVVLVAVIALTVSGGTDQNGGNASNKIEVAEVATVTGTPLPKLPDRGVDPAIGKAAPVTQGVDFDGATVSVPPKGPAVLAVVAHWCPNCQREVPVIMKLRESGRWPANVGLAGLSTAVAPERGNYPASAWLESAGWDAPVLVDTKDQQASEAYGLTGFPFLVWTDASGKVVLRTSGEIPEAELASMLEQLGRGEIPTAPRL